MTVKNTSQPSGATVNTTVNYNAAAVQGATTVQQVTLENVFNPAFPAGAVSSSTVTVNGVETFNVVGAGTAASNLNALVSNTLKTVNISGGQAVTIGAITFAGATGVVDAKANTAGVDVTLTNSGAGVDVSVTGGAGADRADFSAGFGAKDSYVGGAGTDTIVLQNATAVAGVTGTLSEVEVLEISDAASGTVALDAFTGVNRVTYAGGLGGATTLSKTGAAVTVDTAVGATAQNLTIAAKTDSAADSVTLNLTGVGANDKLGVVSANDAETITINVSDDAAVLGTGVLTIDQIVAGDAKAMVINSNADLVVSATTSAALTSLNASGSTGDLTITAGLSTTSAATIVLGAGDDQLLSGTTKFADTVTLGAGDDVLAYTSVAQSDDDMDTVTDFVSGTDALDLSNLNGAGTGTTLNGIVSATQFVGNREGFGLAQGALTAGDGAIEAVYDTDAQILWVDSDDNGQLDNADFRVKLSGVTKLTAADLNVQIAGATVTLAAGASNVGPTGTPVAASGNTTAADDVITGTYANVVGDVINGGLGKDTLTVTGDAAALTSLTAAGASGVALTSVETVTFSEVNGVMNLGGNIGTDVKNVTLNGANAALTANATAAGQTFVVNNTSGANTSTIGDVGLAKVSITTGAAADAIGVGGASSTVNAGAGNDTVTLTAAIAETSTVNGGTGTDTLAVTGAITVDLTKGSFTNLESLNLNDAGAAAQVVTLSDGFRSVLFGDAGDDVKVTVARANALTTINVGAAGDGELILTNAGTVDLTEATVGAAGDIGKLTLAAGGNNVVVDGGSVVAFDAIAGGAGTDTVTLDLEGQAVTYGTAVAGEGTLSAIENLVVLDTTGAGTLNLAASDASGLKSIDASSLNTATTVDISGLTTANGATTVLLGSKADTLATGISGAGNNNLTVDFGTGNGTVTDILAGGTGTFTFAIDSSAGATTTLNIAATTADLATGDTFDFNGAVVGITAAGAGVAGQAIVTSAGGNTTILWDANGDDIFGAGDIQVTVVGQVLAPANLSIVDGNLVVV
ncbi:hypothetical protein [Phenylobacterium sp.]|uniref:beta strand repeat-containing protein n=1 Tax=Phenylobacterium sp. TaxID=1871053 RepID=UPI002F9299A4